MKIVGYTDRFSVRPGQTIRFMVSSEVSTYSACIIRLRHTDANPDGPGFKYDSTPTSVDGQYQGKSQAIHNGSYAIIPHNALLNGTDGLTLQAWIYPTTPEKGVQALLSKWPADSRSGYSLCIDEDGSLALWIGGDQIQKVRTTVPLKKAQWTFVAATYDAASGEVCLYQRPQVQWPVDSGTATIRKTISSNAILANEADFLMAATWDDRDSGPFATAHFNGKIDNPRLYNRPYHFPEQGSFAAPSDADASLIANWDFSLDISSDKITDTHAHQLHGRAINLPTRAMTGHNWHDDEMCFTAAPSKFGAIHFYDDDLEDAQWEVGFAWTVPGDWPNGVYAAHLSNAEGEDYVPFFVTPKPGTARAPIAFLASTASYLIYANQRFSDPIRDALRLEDSGATSPQDQYMKDHRLLSCYEWHSDGSGVCYSSLLRPILNFRPLYRMPAKSLAATWPRHLSAELHLLDWMDTKGFVYDVITDDELDRDGVDLLQPYKVIVTSTHPEYWSTPMLDGLESYQADGGRLMYLGGNGFYWITSFDPQRPHIVEVRRWRGTRTWEAKPGECYHSTTGEMGGLWRFRGRAPQKIVGVGFTSQGGGENRPYKRQPDSFDPRAAFIFAGIDDDELIGDFPALVLGQGAAGFEIDRMDHTLGTPNHALLLASSTGYSDLYQLAIEDQFASSPNTGGTGNALIRSDMVYFEGPANGAVFSVGSISWCASLSYNDGDNNVSRITENVLRKFSSE